jgi:hypothetical protein
VAAFVGTRAATITRTGAHLTLALRRAGGGAVLADQRLTRYLTREQGSRSTRPFRDAQFIYV